MIENIVGKAPNKLRSVSRTTMTDFYPKRSNDYHALETCHNEDSS